MSDPPTSTLSPELTPPPAQTNPLIRYLRPSTPGSGPSPAVIPAARLPRRAFRAETRRDGRVLRVSRTGRAEREESLRIHREGMAGSWPFGGIGREGDGGLRDGESARRIGVGGLEGGAGDRVRGREPDGECGSSVGGALRGGGEGRDWAVGESYPRQPENYAMASWPRAEGWKSLSDSGVLESEGDSAAQSPPIPLYRLPATARRVHDRESHRRRLCG